MGTKVHPIPPIQKKIPTVRPCNAGSTCPSRIAIKVGKIGPTTAPDATTSMHINVAPRQNTIPSVIAILQQAIIKTRDVSAPIGNINAVTNRDPMKVSQNNDSRVDAFASLTFLSVIKVVAQVAIDASVGIWKKNAIEQSQTTGSVNRVTNPPATDWVAVTFNASQSTPIPKTSGIADTTAKPYKVRINPNRCEQNTIINGVTKVPIPKMKSPIFIAYAMRCGSSSGGTKAGGEVTFKTLTNADQPVPKIKTATRAAG